MGWAPQLFKCPIIFFNFYAVINFQQILSCKSQCKWKRKKILQDGSQILINPFLKCPYDCMHQVARDLRNSCSLFPFHFHFSHIPRHSILLQHSMASLYIASGKLERRIFIHNNPLLTFRQGTINHNLLKYDFSLLLLNLFEMV